MANLIGCKYLGIRWFRLKWFKKTILI
jgi:hypothetical protein